MTVSNPEVQAILVTCIDRDGETILSRGVRLIENHDPNCVNEDWNYDPLVRLSDYEAMRIEYLGTLTRAIEQIVEMEAEIKKLRKDAEFGQSVLSKREPGKKYGCHCDLEEDMEPDGCAIDEGNRLNCVHARHIETKEQCEYWRVIASDADMQEANNAG